MTQRFSTIQELSEQESQLELHIDTIEEKLSFLYPQRDIALDYVNSLRGASPSVLRQKAAIDRKILALQTKLQLLRSELRTVRGRLDRAGLEGLVLA